MKPMKSSVIIVALAVLLAGVSMMLVAKTVINETKSTPIKQNTIPAPEMTIPAPTYMPVPETKESTSLTSLPALEDSFLIPSVAVPLSVDWLTLPQKLTPSQLGIAFGLEPSSENMWGTKIFKVGSIHGGEYTGNDLNFIRYTTEFGDPYYEFLFITLPADKKIVLLGRHASVSNSPDKRYPEFLKFATNDPSLIIHDLDTPEKIYVRGTAYAALRQARPMGLAQENRTWEVLGKTSSGLSIHQSNTKQPALILKNGELVTYLLEIPFYSDHRIPNIRWDDGGNNIADYTPFTYGGCGVSSTMNAIDVQLTGLRAAGKTTNGETVYLYKDKENSELKSVYDNWYVWGYDKEGYYDEDSIKPSYEFFLSQKPIFFWRDPFGRMIKWTRIDVMPVAECGKPVVYLYPTQTEQVSVKLGSNVEVTKSDPEYAEGWKVTAEPNGNLTTADGKTYPYLYWDGNGASYNTPTTGFVVASKNVEATLTEKLTQLGLNEKEIADFNEFWVPIVSKSPYALISFVPQDEWSKAAPLDISPAPDTVIRVFMDWKPLSAPITIDPQILPPTPTRSGFTAVEWGGLLYK